MLYFKIMIPVELGIMLIIATVIVAILYVKMIFIWRHVMLEQNERWFNDAEKLRKLSE